MKSSVALQFRLWCFDFLHSSLQTNKFLCREVCIYSMIDVDAVSIVTRMQALSSDFRIGFGSFIDKTVPPFADKFA